MRRRLAHLASFPLAALAALTAADEAHATSPTGEVFVTCEGVSGWALDPDDPAAAIDVHLYFDGPAGDPGATGLPLHADLALPGCRGQACGHGFRARLPLGRLDGQPHPVHAYGIDIGGVDPNPELAASPVSYACPPLPLVEGVRRHILSPPVLDAWRFSILFDMMKIADVDLAAAPVGPDIGEGPALVIADGDPAIWLLDQGFRREVGPEAMAGWRITPADAAPIAPAELAALPEGTPLPAFPILLQGTGPAVFLLDLRQCLPGDPDPACPAAEGTTGGEDTDGSTTSAGTTTAGSTDSTSTATSTSDSTATSAGATDGPATTAASDAASSTATTDADADADGCACRSIPLTDPAPLSLLLVLIPLARRRRPAPHRS